MLMKYKHPPDGGWGWVVTFTACLTYAIVWAVPRGYSVLFKDFQENFNSTNYETSWITSLMVGFLACGTLAGSFVTSMVGPRVTMMLGGAISCTGNIIISQAQSLSTAYCGSIISGVGFGFAYCSGPSQIGMYFDKKRSIAFAIASIGSPAYGIIMPLLLVALAQEYAWRGAILVAAGICLNLVVGGALLRPVLIFATDSIEKCDCKKTTEDSDSVVNLKAIEAGGGKSHSSVVKTVEDKTGSQALVHLQYPMVDTMGFWQIMSKSTSHLYLNNIDRNRSSLENIVSVSLPHLPDTTNKKPSKTRNSIFHKALFNHLEDNINTTYPDSTGGKIEEKHALYRNNDNWDKISNISSADSRKIENVNKDIIYHKKNRVMSLLRPYALLLRHWRFMLFVLVGSLDYLVRLVPTSFIVVHAQTQGLDKEQGAMLLVVFAIFDTTIRPISGFTTNRLPQASLRQGIEIFAFGCAQGTMFVLNLLAPHATNFLTLAIYMAMYGITNGLNSAWCFPILSRLVPANHLHHAVGVFHFFCGIGLLSGPPLAGLLADITGHYYAVFYFTSIAMLLSCGFAWTLYFLTKRWGIRPNEEPAKQAI